MIHSPEILVVTLPFSCEQRMKRMVQIIAPLRLEGAASLAAYKKLRASGFLKESDRVVLFNTGTGMKYFEAVAEYLKIPLPAQKKELPKTRNIGGIIQPT